ncbi:MAG: outer membrane porin protein LC, partial [Psychromonas sp.]
MKKTLLATLILSSFISGAVSAATVYDKEDTKLSIGGRAEVR